MLSVKFQTVKHIPLKDHQKLQAAFGVLLEFAPDLVERRKAHSWLTPDMERLLSAFNSIRQENGVNSRLDEIARMKRDLAGVNLQEKAEQDELNRAENTNPELELDDLIKGSPKVQAVVTNFTKIGGADPAARLPSPDGDIVLEGGSEEDAARQSMLLASGRLSRYSVVGSSAYGGFATADTSVKSGATGGRSAGSGGVGRFDGGLYGVNDASILKLSGVSKPGSDASDYGSEKKKDSPKKKPSPVTKKPDAEPKPAAIQTTKRKSNENAGSEAVYTFGAGHGGGRVWSGEKNMFYEGEL
ncbi:hypothetical protein HK097_010323 [Rhizophlyctis rosea]|uniref:Uncharacterized protein n=1 Tax=Rhizophlyctis rosea TaxID=64517 RepID=A0AAD5S9B5_9FUNG|nr:hypothetical protein HK097_010323 [Rhizophlyctis rosea]